MKARYYPALDGLRTVAVAIVLLAHAKVPFLKSGGVGVDIFFVLSGFLITGLLSHEMTSTGKIRLRSFYFRRLLRLGPCLLATCILFAILFTIYRGKFPLLQIAIALSYTTNWARGVFGIDMSSLGHCWSLAIEEQYYLIWPLVVIGLEKTLKTKIRIGFFLLMLAFAAAAYRYFFVGIYSSDRIYYGLDTHMDGLILGSCLSYCVRHQQSNSSRQYDTMHWALSFIMVPLSIGSLAFIISTMTWHNAKMGQYGYLLAATASAVLIADIVISKYSFLKKPLEWAPMIYLGKISYGLYLLHYPIFYAADKTLTGIPLLAAVFLKLMAALVLAALSWRFIEQPALRLKDRLDSNSQAKGHVTALG